MDSKEPFVFQIDSPDVLKAFDANNYFIEYDNSVDCDQDLCVIYFSSNEIYYPNTSNAFDYSIIKRNKYEWKRNKFPNAGKHIFIRDIRKQWYIGGINTALDTPLKMIDFLKTETHGYKVYTLGSSAGGYAAILFGSMLQASRVYAFNAQLNLQVTMKTSGPLTDPILFERIENKEYNFYFNLSNFIASGDSTDYYYFQSCRSQMDLDQYTAITENAKKKLKIVKFKTSNHGFPFLRINLPNILTFEKNDLEFFVNKTFHPILFSVRLIGVFATFRFVLKALIDRYKKKQLEASLKK
ncbi:MAG: hypothetical protein Q8R22_01955 [Flavobacterium sp.]|uniref:hypothetical protein n=1 Tax=Flavobacterium sp. TaxID=239 RepID=UPI002734588D|nr:hypothetical protein [Flavobacterium sp.]MDP3679581.1 hypothetical protein [Flavobacterium sp.]MDZ4329020.1 hypothetical protein [Flavobacterium sp.]